MPLLTEPLATVKTPLTFAVRNAGAENAVEPLKFIAQPVELKLTKIELK